ncbi:hypothetical protein K461DRAFT_296543 [Myriangium duriaei CBS 260.36]|uniref:Aminoglycoside phosphotransferase domain-containing protein n=1 Tax=Myriangium duriaei CBS 260.36 TaxID=1168546 RepID=A0A9P4IYI2_9PEZI|nr:hypothetical protein K461DRAFT_296543 [Myriangium duriaei CBS 260.36]
MKGTTSPNFLLSTTTPPSRNMMCFSTSSTSSTPSHQTTFTPASSLESNGETLERSIRGKLPALFKSLSLDVSTVELLGEGSSYIAFVFVNTQATGDLPAGSFVIRVPFYDWTTSEMLDEATILNLLKKFPIHTPNFCLLDVGTENQLSKPYTISHRVPGEQVAGILAEINMVNWFSIGKAVCDQMVQMNSITFNEAGKLESDSKTTIGSLSILPYQNQKLEGSVADWLRQLISIQLKAKQKFLQDGGHTKWFLFKVIDHLEKLGYFQCQNAEKIVLVHGDFHGGNIMAEQTKGIWNLNVIDWGSAHALPQCLASRSVEFFWSDKADDDAELAGRWNGNIDFIPDEYMEDLPDAEAALKTHLDAYMTQLIPTYMEDTYGAGRWARRVAKFALQGWKDNRDWAMLDWMKEQWEKDMGEKVMADDDDVELLVRQGRYHVDDEVTRPGFFDISTDDAIVEATPGTQMSAESVSSAGSSMIVPETRPRRWKLLKWFGMFRKR